VPESTIIEGLDRRVGDPGRRERLETVAGALADTGGNVFPPGLVGSHPKLLGRLHLAVVLDEALPALPREFVVVADADEREMSARILDVGIIDVSAIHHAIAVEARRDVKVADPARIGDAADVEHGAVVAVRY